MLLQGALPDPGCITYLSPHWAALVIRRNAAKWSRKSKYLYVFLMTFPCLPASFFTQPQCPENVRLTAFLSYASLKAGLLTSSGKVVKSLEQRFAVIVVREKVVSIVMSAPPCCGATYAGSSATTAPTPLFHSQHCSQSCGPQERPDFDSDALCSIALNVRSCWNGAR